MADLFQKSRQCLRMGAAKVFIPGVIYMPEKSNKIQTFACPHLSDVRLWEPMIYSVGVVERWLERH
jgi:hypothetical protein